MVGDPLYDFSGTDGSKGENLNEITYSAYYFYTPLEFGVKELQWIRFPRYDLPLRPFNNVAWTCLAVFLLFCSVYFFLIYKFYQIYMPECDKIRITPAYTDFIIVPFSAFWQFDPIRWFKKEAWGGHGILLVWIFGCFIVGKTYFVVLRGMFHAGRHDAYYPPDLANRFGLDNQNYKVYCSEIECAGLE